MGKGKTGTVGREHPAKKRDESSRGRPVLPEAGEPLRNYGKVYAFLELELGTNIDDFMVALDNFFLDVSPLHFAQADHYLGQSHQHTYTNNNGHIKKDVKLYHDSPVQIAKKVLSSFLKEPKLFFKAVSANKATISHTYKEGYNRGVLHTYPVKSQAAMHGFGGGEYPDGLYSCL